MVETEMQYLNKDNFVRAMMGFVCGSEDVEYFGHDEENFVAFNDEEVSFLQVTVWIVTKNDCGTEALKKHCEEHSVELEDLTADCGGWSCTKRFAA